MISLLFLLVTAILTIRTVEDAFNDIWQVSNKRSSRQALLLYLLLLIILPIAIILILVISSYLFSLPFIFHATQSLGMQPTLLKWVPFILTTLLLAFLYMVMPNCVVPIHYSCLSALLATLCFEGSKLAFAWYVIHFTTYAVIYGSLAVLPLFLIWIYCCWLIVLGGAILCRQLTIL
jgi:membrane protein